LIVQEDMMSWVLSGAQIPQIFAEEIRHVDYDKRLADRRPKDRKVARRFRRSSQRRKTKRLETDRPKAPKTESRQLKIFYLRQPQNAFSSQEKEHTSIYNGK